MDQFNKAISFFLGLIVVVVFLAVATGKINLKGKTLPFLKGSTVAITPTPTLEPINTFSQTGNTQSKPTPTTQQNSQYRTYSGTVNSVNTIPSTGPEMLLPLVISTFFGGSFLRKISRKK
ncbi:hypothetical protein HZC27_03575 [Candidatus Roizmanbacteria bacterium]|nr:hypothetical protein [Candidatus Roizmanbacteria bacterium]